MKRIIAKLLLLSLALSMQAHGQTLQLRLPFADAGPGTTTASDTNLGTLNVTMNMFSNGTLALNLHGAAGTGITNLNPNAMALDLTTNNVPSQALTEPGGSSDAGPILKLENSATLATGLGNGGVISNFIVTLWMKSVNTLYGGNTPRIWILAPGTTAGDFDGSANGMGFQYQTSAEMYFGFGGAVILNVVQPQNYPVNQWMFFAVTYDGTNFVQYYGTDTQAATAIQTVALSGKKITLGTAASLVIGNRDSSYTRSFNGWMSDFRIYNGTAGAGNLGFIQQIQYQKLTAAPVITSTSGSLTAYTGTTVDLSVTTSTTTGLTYQWQAGSVGSGGPYTNVSNGGQFSGATSSTLVITNLQPGNGLDYVCVATSVFGSITNDGVGSDLPPITLTVSASAPQIVTDINPTNAAETYVGQTVTFSATFAGSLPITYQWMVDTGSGPTPISSVSNPSALSNTLTLSNVQLTNAGTYSVAASNSVGGPVSSSSSMLTVLADPAAPVSGTYGALILSNNPIAYWRFNETGDPSTGILPVYDASGHGFVGFYGQFSQDGCTNATYFSTPIEGPQSPAFPGFETNNTALQTQNGSSDGYVTVPPINPTSTNTFTITMWINPAGFEAASEGLFLNRNGNDAAGFVLGHAENSSGMYELGYNWNNNAATYNFNSELFPPLNQWSFVALVIQPSNATIYLYYIDPITFMPDLYSAVNPVTNAPETFNGGTTLIGSDTVAIPGRTFSGAIDEVAVFNAAFSSDQLLNMFSEAAGLSVVGASIASQPQSRALYAGETVSFTAAGINGTAPITFQWDFISTNNVTNLISGATNATLTISNLSPTNVGYYQLFLTNPAGTTNSVEAALAVVTPAPNSYESAVLELNPLLYWKLDETNDPSASGVVAYDYVNGYNGVYQTAAQNGFDGILGPQPPQFPGFTTNNTAMETFINTPNSYMAASAGNMTASNLTYAMWINPSVPVGPHAGLLFDRGGVGEGFGFGGAVLNTNEAPNGYGMSELYYAWDQNSSSTFGFDSYLYPPTNEWSFVALVIQPAQTTMYLMSSFTGIQSAVNPVPNDTETFGVAWHLGDDAVGGAGGGRTFPGSIDAVSIYLTALSSNQLVGLYNAGLQFIPPVTLYIAPAGAGNLTLTWSQGTLLQSTNLTGPWATNITAVSPYTIAPTNSQFYFKVLVH